MARPAGVTSGRGQVLRIGGLAKAEVRIVGTGNPNPEALFSVLPLCSLCLCGDPPSCWLLARLLNRPFRAEEGGEALPSQGFAPRRARGMRPGLYQFVPSGLSHFASFACFAVMSYPCSSVFICGYPIFSVLSVSPW